MYTVRPSIRTSILLARTLLNPRALIAYWLLSARATWRFGARRRASGMLVAPERRMSSALITKIDAATSMSLSSRRDTDVTMMWLSCSRLISTRSGAAAIVGAAAGAQHGPSAPQVRIAAATLCVRRSAGMVRSS